MKAGEIFAAETPHSAGYQGQCIADRQHGRRTVAGGQAERTRLFQGAQFDNDRRSPAQRAVAPGGDGDDRRAQFGQRRQQADDLFRLAAL